MEILIGLFCAIATYLCVYIDAIKKEKTIIELKELKYIMEDKVTDIILDRIKDFDKRIIGLEKAIEVIKTKIANRAALYSALSSSVILGIFKAIELMAK